MANAFNKEEIVAFERILEGFHDALVMSKAVNVYRTAAQTMERAQDTIWRPMPYVLNSQNRVVGSAVTAQGATQLAVPSTLGFKKNVSWTLDALELRDALQEGRLGQAGYQRLASDINTAVTNVAATQGTLAVAVSTAPGDYDDVALCDTIMNETGVEQMDRHMFLSTRDYNGMAGNLAVATRSFGNNKSDSAYERGLVGMVAGFETHKLDTAPRIAPTTATVTIATNGAQVRYVPQATQTTVGGEINVDNRYQQVTVSTTVGVTAGACFQIADIEAVHLITKQPTGQRKTFRVISVDSGTTMTISPPIIGANSAPTDAELQYKNVQVNATSASAAITWLSVDVTNINPFFHKSAIELLPGSYALPPAGAGVEIIRGSTDQGIEVVMGKKFDNQTFTTLYTLDVLFGVVCTQPEMAGVLLLNQVP
ncbi:P22 phage major capsid protein family protein [Thiocapsa sp. N5-Cardenillas]|uniref:P22 phage major capsid protein family protein n=1 Tax=Thiocapsa sp. N5-Cardenillas TaxID=3137397 RepID=UPI0035B3FC5D